MEGGGKKVWKHFRETSDWKIRSHAKHVRMLRETDQRFQRAFRKAREVIENVFAYQLVSFGDVLILLKAWAPPESSDIGSTSTLAMPAKLPQTSKRINVQHFRNSCVLDLTLNSFNVVPRFLVL